MKILIVKTSSLGDLVHTIYAVEDLYKNRKDIELHWLCEKDFYDIAKLHVYIKKVYTIELRKYKKFFFSKNGWLEIFKIKNKLQNERYDLVIDNQGLIKSLILSKFTKSTIYGLDKSVIKEKIASYFYDKNFILEKNYNAILKNKEFFAKIFKYSINYNKIVVDKNNLLLNWFSKNLYTDYNLFIHTASKKNKLWPVEYWRKLAKLINKYDKKNILLTYYFEDEYKRSLEIAKNYCFIQIVPKLEIHKIVNIINNSNSIIGLDTGLFHLANLLNKPTVGIYNKTLSNSTKVFGRNWQINLGGNNNIPSVHEVFNTWIKVNKNYSLLLKEQKYESFSSS